MKTIKFFILLLAILPLTSCLEKRCQDAKNNARDFPKDTALMYLWRAPDEYILNKNAVPPDFPDSFYLGFKPNGDFARAGTLRFLNFTDVWYVQGDTIYDVGCVDLYQPVDDKYFDYYKIQNDTLLLFNLNYPADPDKLIKVMKYH